MAEILPAADRRIAGQWRSALLAALVTAAVAPLIINTIPAVNGLLAQQLHVGPGMLGAFSSADACGIGAGAVAAAALTRRLTPPVTVLIGVSLLAAANILSALLDWSAFTVVLRVAGGIGTGFALSAATYVLGQGNSERNMAMSMLALMAAAAIAITIVPLVGAQFGWRGMFMLFAILLLPIFAFAAKFPPAFDLTPTQSDGPGGAARMEAWTGLGAVAVGTFGQIAFFTYLGNIGLAAGLPAGTVANSLAISGGAAFAGAVLAVTLGQRLSILPSILAIIALAVIGIACAGSRNPAIYTAGISAFYCAIPLYTTAQFGLLMRRARSLSFAVSVSAAQFCGTALAPAAGGLMIAYSGYTMLQVVCVLCSCSAYGLLILYCMTAPIRPAAALPAVPA